MQPPYEHHTNKANLPVAKTEFMSAGGSVKDRIAKVS